MIATVAVIAAIAAIAEKKKSSAIAAILAILWKPLSSDRGVSSDRGDRSNNDRWYRKSSISAFYDLRSL